MGVRGDMGCVANCTCGRHTRASKRKRSSAYGKDSQAVRGVQRNSIFYDFMVPPKKPDDLVKCLVCKQDKPVRASKRLGLLNWMCNKCWKRASDSLGIPT